MSNLNEMKPPKKWKMAIVIWLSIYPLITIVFVVFNKYLLLVELLPLRTFLITIVLVPIMVFILMPFVQNKLANWLRN